MGGGCHGGLRIGCDVKGRALLVASKLHNRVLSLLAMITLTRVVPARKFPRGLIKIYNTQVDMYFDSWG